MPEGISQRSSTVLQSSTYSHRKNAKPAFFAWIVCASEAGMFASGRRTSKCSCQRTFRREVLRCCKAAPTHTGRTQNQRSSHGLFVPAKQHLLTQEERKSSVLRTDCLCRQSRHVWKCERCKVFLRHKKPCLRNTKLQLGEKNF